MSETLKNPNYHTYFRTIFCLEFCLQVPLQKRVFLQEKLIFCAKFAVTEALVNIMVFIVATGVVGSLREAFDVIWTTCVRKMENAWWMWPEGTSAKHVDIKSVWRSI